MTGWSLTHIECQNFSARRITLTFLGLATFVVLVGGYGNFAFSQGEQLGLAPTSNETIPGSPDSSQAPLGFVTEGTVNTLITLPNGKWLATGNWSLILNNGNVTSFETKMTWYNSTGTNAHTHELTNFRKSLADIQGSPVSATAKQIIIKGVSDVGANGRVSWTEIPTTITINDRKIISIAIDDTKTNRHFGGQPLLGIVDSFVPCSDLPGPNMELLPSCTASTVGDEIFGQSNESLGLPPEGFTPPQGVPLGEFPQQPFPDQGSSGGDQAFPDQGSSGGDQAFPDQGSSGGDQPFPDQPFPDQGFSGADFPPENNQSQGESPSENNQSANDMNPECDDLTIENVTASGFESDPSDYHPPADAIDGESSTWWSNNGNDPWLQIDLGESQNICGVTVQWNKGDSREYSFAIEVSANGNDYQKVFEGKNNEGSSEPETHVFAEEVNGQFIRLTTTDTSSGDGWVSIQELGVLGTPLQ